VDGVKRVRKRDRVGTRDTMVAAARSLFLEQGYARTTIADIARRADIAPQTVYWAFGSKAGLVAEIRERWFAEARTGERLRAVLATADPAARLDAYATFMTGQWVTGAEAVAIQEDAMRADASVAVGVQRALAERSGVLAEVTRPLEGVLRDGMSRERAHAILLGLSMSALYLELRSHGWTPEAYRDWLSGVLREQLL